MFWVLHYDCTMVAWIDGIGWSYSLDDHFLEGCCLDGCFLVVNLLMLGKLRLMVILQTSSKSKIKLTAKLLRRNWMPEQLSVLLIHCHRHSTLASQTYEGLHQLWAVPRLLSIAYFSWLFRHPVFLFTLLFQHSHLGYL